MEKFVGVTFRNQDAISYFFIDKTIPKKNITVIVKTDGCLQFGKVVTKIMSDVTYENKIIGKIIRISNKNDYHNYLKNQKDEKKALIICKNLVKKLELSMQIVDVNYSFDRSQLLFRFVADNRVDFRQLAKELAKIYKTRIELRQIGIRDKAKEIGGIGLCGTCLCCSRFLKEFNSVSISMAKNQNISLNPSKINGVCGRLLCCLKYEDDQYTSGKKCLAKVGQTMMLEEGEGKVVEVDVLNKKYKVEVPKVGIIEVKEKNNIKNGSNK